VVLVGFKPDLDDLLVLLQCFDTVGLVVCPVKIVPEMTYYVSSGTLNPTHSLCSQNDLLCVEWKLKPCSIAIPFTAPYQHWTHCEMCCTVGWCSKCCLVSSRLSSLLRHCHFVAGFQANISSLVVATQKDLLELDVTNVLQPPPFLHDDIEFDIEVIRKWVGIGFILTVVTWRS